MAHRHGGRFIADIEQANGEQSAVGVAGAVLEQPPVQQGAVALKLIRRIRSLCRQVGAQPLSGSPEPQCRTLNLEAPCYWSGACCCLSANCQHLCLCQPYAFRFPAVATTFLLVLAAKSYRVRMVYAFCVKH